MYTCIHVSSGKPASCDGAFGVVNLALILSWSMSLQTALTDTSIVSSGLAVASVRTTPATWWTAADARVRPVQDLVSPTMIHGFEADFCSGEGG